MESCENLILSHCKSAKTCRAFVSLTAMYSATGFDSVTGGMKTMGLKDVDGVELAEKWKAGTWTYLGLTCSGL